MIKDKFLTKGIKVITKTIPVTDAMSIKVPICPVVNAKPSICKKRNISIYKVQSHA